MNVQPLKLAEIDKKTNEKIAEIVQKICEMNA
jgi:hypothetical protein